MRCRCHNQGLPPEWIAAFIAGTVIALLLPSWLILLALLVLAGFAIWRLCTADSCHCCC